MAKQKSYSEVLKQDFGQLFETLDLGDRQKQFLRSRWLDQVVWMENRALQCRNRYYYFRLTAIVLGVIVPILVGLSPVENKDQQPFLILKWVTISFSSVVAISAAVEEFFHYGERWYHYRRTVESLKSQGWQYFELCGPYNRYNSHGEAFGIFAEQVEEIIQRDVEVYVTQVVKQDKTTKNRDENKPTQNDS